jgi:putative ABC transport system permease protein
LDNARQAAWRPGFRGRNSWATRLGVLCLMVSPMVVFFAASLRSPVQQFSAGVIGMLILLLGLAFLCPLIISSCVKWFWRADITIPGFSWAETRLASDTLRKNPIRSGITVATIVISLAAIFTIAAFVNSVRGSLLAWIDQMVTADLIVSSGARTAGPKNVPLTEDPLPGFKSVAGVKIVDLYRLIRSTYNGMPILIESFSATESAGVRRLPTPGGDGKKALSEMAAGKGVIVSESFHSKFGKGTNDTIELATPAGLVAFKVLAVYIDYSSDIGSVLIDRALYKKFWQDELVDAFDIWLEPGADQSVVIEKIKQDYGEQYELFISTHRQLKESVVRIMEQSFVVNYAVEIVAVIVAVFSVINTLLASVLDRTREIGVLRAIGATQAQIRRMIIFEAAWMGLIGGFLGLIAGTIMSYHHVVYNTKVLTGWTFEYYYPYHLAALSIFVSVILCLLAGYWPAKQAAATPIVSAIGYE